MSYLCYFSLLAHSDVQHILYHVFVLFSSSCGSYITSFSGFSIFGCLLLYSLTFMIDIYIYVLKDIIGTSNTRKVNNLQIGRY